MTGIDHDRQKAADSAFFDDWSEWRDFGRRRDPYSLRRDRPSFGMTLYGPEKRWPRGVFRLSLINNPYISRLMRAIPGVINDPCVREDRRAACWEAPAKSSRELRAALPTIKNIITDWIAKHD